MEYYQKPDPETMRVHLWRLAWAWKRTSEQDRHCPLQIRNMMKSATLLRALEDLFYKEKMEKQHKAHLMRFRELGPSI